MIRHNNENMIAEVRGGRSGWHSDSKEDTSCVLIGEMHTPRRLDKVDIRKRVDCCVDASERSQLRKGCTMHSIQN